MKVKTSNLIGHALDWAVAKCEGIDDLLFICHEVGRFRYSTDWSQGGPIIEREVIGTKGNAPCSKGREWEASPAITAKGAGGKWGYGPTPLIAAMRCYVASKLGDDVEVPDGLVKE